MAEQRTRRVQTNGVQDAFSFSVVAPSNRQVRSNQTARALANSLGITAVNAAEDEFSRRDARAAREAATDYAEGTTRIDDNREVYQRVSSRLQAEADWIADAAVIQQEIQDADVQTLEELDGLLDDAFAQRYGGLDDSYYGEALVGHLAGFRQSQREALVSRQREALIQKQGADLTTVIEAEYESTGAINYEDLNLEAVTLFGRENANEAMFTILKDIAIRNADPEMFERMPDRWSNGVPSFKNIPAFNDKVLNAERQAEAALAAKENEEAARLKAEREDLARLIEAQAYEKALTGTDPTPYLLEQVDEGNIEGKDANRIVTAFRSAEQFVSERSEDPEEFLRLQSDVLTDPSSVSQADLAEAWAAGVFGDPRQDSARETFRQLMKDRDQKLRERRSVETNPAAKRVLEKFRTMHKPQTDVLGNIVARQGERTLFAEAVDEIRARAANGEEPDKVFRDVEERYRSDIGAVKADDLAEGQEAAVVVDRFIAGDRTPEQTVLRLRADRRSDAAIIEELERLSAAGRLPAAKEKALLMELIR